MSRGRSVSSRAVRWLKPRVAVVLLALWVPDPSWLLGLVAVAEGSHPVSIRASHGVLDVVLHHHTAPPAVDEDAFRADDHSHGDHVIHGMRDGALTGRAGHASATLATAARVLEALATPREAAVAARMLIGGFGTSPPHRSVVLRI